jgi:hypothetical protein
MAYPFCNLNLDTDYVLVKEKHAVVALQTLQAAGHELVF